MMLNMLRMHSSVATGHTGVRVAQSVRRAATRTLTAATILAAAACSAITDPYIDMAGAPTSPTFDGAVDFARGKAAEMDGKLRSLEQWDVATGSVIFGSGLVGLGLVAFGAHSDAILGAGLGAGAGYGARSFLPLQDRKVAYSSGSSAIECAITAIALGQPEAAGAGSPFASIMGVPTTRAAPLSDAVGELRTLVRGSGSSGARSLASTPTPTAPAVAASTPATLVAQSAMVAARRQLLAESVERTDDAAVRLIAATEAAIDLRGPRLIAATGVIVDQLRTQLLAAKVDPDAALDALRKRSSASSASTRAAAKEVKEAASGVAAEKQKLDAAVNELEQKAAATGKGAPVASTIATVRSNAGAEVDRTAAIADRARRILELVKLGTECLDTNSGKTGELPDE